MSGSPTTGSETVSDQNANASPCPGFVWIGQPFDTCDRCGQPAWEHAGIERVVGGGPFGLRFKVVPWAEGELARIRGSWDWDWERDGE